MQDYTDDFKMVSILATFRRALTLNGVEFERNVIEYRKTTNRPWVDVDKTFLTKIEMGVERLNKREIQLYVEYIAKALEVENANWLYNAIKHEADRMKATTPIEAMKAISKVCFKLYNL